MTKPTTPKHKDNADRPLEHISNSIAKSSNPIPKLLYFISPHYAGKPVAFHP